MKTFRLCSVYVLFMFMNCLCSDKIQSTATLSLTLQLSITVTHVLRACTVVELARACAPSRPWWSINKTNTVYISKELFMF